MATVLELLLSCLDGCGSSSSSLIEVEIRRRTNEIEKKKGGESVIKASEFIYHYSR
jgi:hypothetical protein